MSLFDNLFSKEKKESLDKGLEKSKENFFSKLGKAIVGKSTVDDEVLDNLEEILVSSDVGVETTLKIIERIQERVAKDKYLGTSELDGILREEIASLLSQNNTEDLKDFDIPAGKKPYVIMVVGVNGVGKSTTLSKVCSWLKQNELSVLIAACDTFRAGAVEQLYVHARNLDVPLHHKGYGKKAASVAREAISKAAREKIDVVLIDTAGRMQDNKPLMESLAELVGLNRPDLVLFVGEALVGNDSVDQLTKFNRALEEYSADKSPRLIDGIIFSKFDTVDDKVGAAISMVYSTGQPIVFVGVGQKYSDLRVLNVPRIVSILLKGH